MNTLRQGSSGADVTRLQQTLNRVLSPSPNLGTDGIFGPQTKQAVVRFQQANGLDADGVVGPRTWEALQRADGSGGAQAPADTGDPAWLGIARGELAAGVAEIPGQEHHPRIIQYHATTSLKAKTDEVPWCSSFVNWCLQQAGVRGTNSAAAASWLDWGVPIDARRGAITVIFNQAAAGGSLTSSGNHVGFLLAETDTHYRLLGGNQGNRVKESSFPKTGWRLKGYRWPG